MNKRFRVNDLVKFNYSEIGEYVDENHTDRPLRNDEVCDLLNGLSEENEQLRKELDNFKPVMFQDVRKGTVILYSKGDIDE